MECIVFTMNICLGERIRIRHHKNTTFYLKKKQTTQFRNKDFTFILSYSTIVKVNGYISRKHAYIILTPINPTFI